MVLGMDIEAPVQHLDSIFSEKFAILNEDGTFYKEVDNG
jgi:hypothetical protein